MSDQEVKIQMTATEAGVLRILQQLERGFQKQNEKLAEIEQQSRRTTDTVKSGFSSMGAGAEKLVGQITGITSGFALARIAAQKLKQEWDDLHQRQAKAADVQVDFATQMRQLLRQSAGTFGEKRLETSVERIAAVPGVTKTQAAEAIGRAIQAVGAHDEAGLQRSEQLAIAAKKLGPEMPEDESDAIIGTGARILEHSKKGTTAEAAIGFLLLAQKASGLTGSGALGRVIAPGTVHGIEAGLSPAESTALTAAIAHGSGTTEARAVGGAVAELLEGLQKRFPGQNLHDVLGKLQTDAQLRKRVFHPGPHGGIWAGGKELGALEMPAKIGQAVDRLFSGKDLAGNESVEARVFRETKAAVGDAATGAKAFQDLQRQFQQVPGADVIAKRQAGEASAQQGRIEDLRGAQIGEIRKQLQENLSAAGVGYWQREWMDIGEFDLSTATGADPRAVARRILRSESRAVGVPKEQRKRLQDLSDKLAPDNPSSTAPALPAAGVPTTSLPPRGTGGEGGSHHVRDHMILQTLQEIRDQGRRPTPVVSADRPQYSTQSRAGYALSVG